MPVAKAPAKTAASLGRGHPLERSPGSSRPQGCQRQDQGPRCQSRAQEGQEGLPTRPQGRQGRAQGSGGVAGGNHQRRGKSGRRREESPCNPARAQDGSFKSCRECNTASASHTQAGAKNTPSRFIDPLGRGCRLHRTPGNPIRHVRRVAVSHLVVGNPPGAAAQDEAGSGGDSLASPRHDAAGGAVPPVVFCSAW